MVEAISWLSREVVDAQHALALSELEFLAADLLGMRFRDGGKNYQTHVGGRFIWIDRLHLERDYLARNAEILKLQFLFKHLQELRRLHAEAYVRARRIIRRAPNEAQFFGARMEVYVAASLARRSIEFVCRESPDYELRGNHGGVLIECGSAHVVKDNSDAAKKLALSVVQKCKKNYARRNVALFLDATNAVHHAIYAAWPVDVKGIRESVLKVIMDRGYGSVMLLSYGFDHQVSKISANYIRIDAPDIDLRLMAFMDKVYPRGGTPAPVTFYPNQG